MKHFLLGVTLAMTAVCVHAQANRELVLQLPHREAVVAVAPSPDGSRFATAAQDGMNPSGEVKVWTRQGELLRTLRPAQENLLRTVSCVAWRDNRTLITGNADGTAHFWNAVTGQWLGGLKWSGGKPRGEMLSLYASSDGQTIAAGLRAFQAEDEPRAFEKKVSVLALWRKASGAYRLWGVLPLQSPLQDVQFIPGAPSVLLIGDKCTVLDLVTRKTHSLSAMNKAEVGFYRKVRPTGVDGVIELKRLGDGKVLRRMQLNRRSGSVDILALSPNETELVAGMNTHNSQCQLVWFDTRSGRPVTSRERVSAGALMFFQDGKTLLCGEERDGASVWDNARRARMNAITVPVERIGPILFSPDSRLLVSGGEDGSLRVWDIQKRSLLRTINEHTGWINALAFSRDGRKMASAGIDGKIQIWDTRSFRRLAQWRDEAEQCVFSADGKDLFVLNGGRGDSPCEVRVWDAVTGQLKNAVTGHGQPVFCAALSEDGKWLASASADGTVKIWNTTNLDCETTLKASTLEEMDGDVLRGNRRDFNRRDVYASALAWSGSRLAIGNTDWSLRIWNFETRKIERVLQQPRGRIYNSFSALRFLPGNLLEGSLTGGALFTWKLANGALIDTVWPLVAAGTAVDEYDDALWSTDYGWAQTISPDNRLAACVSRDGGITIAERETGRPIATFLILPKLTEAEIENNEAVSLRWIAYAPDGKINASSGAKEFIRWRAGGKLLPASP